jgi:MerR HTH family regulatory protein
VTAEAAAAMLGTSTRILSLWEERFGFPVADRSGDGQSFYPDEMMVALRDALTRELSIVSAITHARRVRGIHPRTTNPTVNGCRS